MAYRARAQLEILWIKDIFEEFAAAPFGVGGTFGEQRFRSSACELPYRIGTEVPAC